MRNKRDEITTDTMQVYFPLVSGTFTYFVILSSE